MRYWKEGWKGEQKTYKERTRGKDGKFRWKKELKKGQEAGENGE